MFPVDFPIIEAVWYTTCAHEERATVSPQLFARTGAQGVRAERVLADRQNAILSASSDVNSEGKPVYAHRQHSGGR